MGASWFGVFPRAEKNKARKLGGRLQRPALVRLTENFIMTQIAIRNFNGLALGFGMAILGTFPLPSRPLGATLPALASARSAARGVIRIQRLVAGRQADGRGHDALDRQTASPHERDHD